MRREGQVVGVYELGEVLGEGGMATVYAARHVALGTSHALKVLRPELLAIDEVRARFLAEARLLANLRLPGVVEVTDIVAEPGVAGIVMARLHGATLAEWGSGGLAPPDSPGVAREQPSVDARLVLFRTLAETVAALHERGVVHRDLKPENVLVIGEPPRPVLLDFGIAKLAETLPAARTRMATRMGTPAYMSPEQIRDASAVDARSDVWSLGVVLYELLSGSLPFDGASDVDLYAAVIAGKATPLSRRVPGLDPAVAAAVDRALSTDPAARPADAADLLRALDTPEPRPAGAARVDRWRDLLLDLSLRNRLLAFRPTIRKVVRVEAADLGALEDHLAQGRPLRLLGRVPPEGKRLADPLPAADTPEGRRLRADALARGEGLSDLTAAELDKRLVALSRDARVAIEDAGSNMLFCALGLLAWKERASAEPRLAPLVLYPVRLERRGQAWELVRGAEDPVPNRALVEKITREYGLSLDVLTELPTDENGLDLAGILAKVRAAVAPRGWEVREEAWIGLFTFAKFTMWRDLHEHAATLLENPLTRALAAGQATPELAARRALPDTHRLPLVLDADATQTDAVHAATLGENMVLQGPPGTGKSQTIANLIAASVAGGKTVLFVAEKMAALEVVHRRLQASGLADACLELHSNKANKRAVVDELGRTLRARAEAAPDWERAHGDLDGMAARLDAHVAALHRPRGTGETVFEVCETLVARAHAPRIGRIAASALGSADASRGLAEAVEALAAAAGPVEPVAENPWWQLAPDPDRLDALGPAQLRAAEAEADAVPARARSLRDAAAALARLLGESLLSGPFERSRVHALLRAADVLMNSADVDLAPAAVPALVATAEHDAAAADLAARLEQDAARRAELAQRWTDRLYALPVRPLRARFKQWAGAFFVFAWFFLRTARQTVRRAAAGALPPDRRVAADLAIAEQVLADAPALAEARAWASRALAPVAAAPAEPGPEGTRLRRALAWLAEARTVGIPAASFALAGRGGDAAARERVSAAATTLRAALQAYETSLATLEGALALPADHPLWPAAHEPGHLDAVEARLAAWRSGGAWPRLRAWVKYLQAGAKVAAAGGERVVAAHRSGVPATLLVAAFERARAESWLDDVLDAEPALREFSGPVHERSTARFAAADREILAVARAFVRAEAARRRPDGVGASETSEVGVLLRETKRQRGHLPVRTLLSRIPHVLPRLKPCLLMSPLSVAQYLPPDWRFDLVVFDEASQICTHDAVGAIARGRQVVVVGDTRQLPPTNFFATQAAEETEGEELPEMESVLDELAAAGLPQRMLRWHYRSRHESLISFSNHAYYEGELVTFPSAVATGGVHWRPVAGVYDRAGTATNPIEARALVDELVRRLVTDARTYGVVTFSRAQQVLIEDLLDEARRKDPAVDARFSAEHEEPPFVKNLENVQGDERDVILFSVCYGPDAQGAVTLNFGPLSQRGGERRLNVAITRARQELVIFSTLRADQIDVSRTSSVGTRHLRDFLAYVASGGRSGAAIEDPSRAARAALAEDVANELRTRGHDVAIGVGQGQQRVDLAIRAPGEDRFLLGIELDGPTYRDAGRARDRDRLRAQVLTGLGWRLHRVWTLDWVEGREQELARLLAAIEAAKAAPPEPPPAAPPAPPEADGDDDLADDDLELEVDVPAPRGLLTTPYTAATLPPAEGDFYTASTRLRDQLAALVEGEGPVHVTAAYRRVAAEWGIARLGNRVQAALDAALQRLALNGRVRRRGDFLWRVTDDPASWQTVRVSGEGEGAREAWTIAPEEVAAAMAAILARDVSMPRAALGRAAARVFGIQHYGAKVQAAMEPGVDALLARGAARVEGERVVLAG